MKDLRQTISYARFMGKRCWIVEKVVSASNSSCKLFLYIKRIPFLPISVAKLQRFEMMPDFRALEKIARKHRVVSLTLEPGIIPGFSSSQIEKVMVKNGFKKSNSPFLPTKTVHIDLTKSEKILLSQMKKDARMSISKAKKNIKAKLTSTDQKLKIIDFYSFWKKHGKGYIPSFSEFSLLCETFGQKVFVITAYDQEELLAGAVILLTSDIAYYYFAVTSSLGRREFAGYLVVWEAMREARERKCKIFDLEGIYDDRFIKLKRWKGFTLFKKKFGGEEVFYPGIYSRLIVPI